MAGLGNVGRSFLQIAISQADVLAARHGLRLVLVGAADSGGAAASADGIDLAEALAIKQRRASIAGMAGVGRPGVGGIELARSLEADVLLEATPVNLQDGQPGLETALTALRRGIHVVLANKAPLALAYQQLAELSDMGAAGEERGSPRDWPALRFSACVGGALPTINIGLRDLAGARIERFEAVLNGTTQGILRAMEQGTEYGEALAEMQRRGVAEADPTLDVDGWDAANKLTIVANAVLRQPTTVRDVQVAGIRGLTAELLREHVARGERIVLLCLAERDGDRYRLSVQPTPLPHYHPLARMSDEEMGLVYYTDISGVATATSVESDPVPTAAAMLRDVIEVGSRQ